MFSHSHHLFTSSAQRLLSQLLPFSSSLPQISQFSHCSLQWISSQRRTLTINTQQQNLDLENPQPSQSSSSRTCSSALSRLFSLRCLIVIVLSFVILLSAIFWLFPRPSHSNDTFVEVTASIEACFKLHKPASVVISHKRALEHDIFQSIGHANTKVTILSLNQSGSSNNWTDVEFGVIPNPTNFTISKHSSSSLRASFVKLFTHRSKLNLTSSRFRKPTSFQVLKFPGGITIDPLGSKPVSRVLVILFDFTLHKSLSEIQDCLGQLNDQLDDTLCLEPSHESVHILFTNKQGSTISPPVTVEVSVISTSTMRNHLQQRFDPFAQIIQTSQAKNLGLNSSVFGEVKSITYSTDLDPEMIDSASVVGTSAYFLITFPLLSFLIKTGQSSFSFLLSST